MQKKDVLIPVGILFLLVGAVLIVMAGPSASSNDSNNPEKYALWRGGSKMQGLNQDCKDVQDLQSP